MDPESTRVIEELKNCSFSGERPTLESLVYRVVSDWDLAFEYLCSNDSYEANWEVPYERLMQEGLQCLSDDEIRDFARNPCVVVALSELVHESSIAEVYPRWRIPRLGSG